MFLKGKTAAITLSTLLLCCFTTLINAQGRYVGQLSKNDVDKIIKNLEDSGDNFRRDFRSEVDRSNLSSSQKKLYKNQVDNFERATDRLRSDFDNNNSWWESRNQVQSVISASRPLNVTMNGISFRRKIERQWNRLRDAINRLADTYDLPGIAGGGWNGGPWYPGNPGNPGWGTNPIITNPPSWAVGSFSGTASNGSQVYLTINQNGTAFLNAGAGAVQGSYGSGDMLYFNNVSWRVTRVVTGIAATRIDNNERIVFVRQGLGNPGVPTYPGEQVAKPPSWATGSFFANSIGASFNLYIDANGSVTLQNGNSTVYGYYVRGNYMRVGGVLYRVSKRSNGIRIQRTGTNEITDLRRQ